jgi:hypothetical protein
LRSRKFGVDLEIVNEQTITWDLRFEKPYQFRKKPTA